MSAAAYDIVVERYAAWSQEFVYKDASGVPVNLAGASARMQVRKNRKSDEVLLELTDQDGITLGEKGEIEMFANEAETADWDFDGVYDLKVNEERVLEGDFRVKAGVTRD